VGCRLQLAALSMQDRPDAHDFVAAFTGSHHYIMDYLLEEVLKRQPESMRTFCSRPPFSSAFAAALRGRRRRERGTERRSGDLAGTGTPEPVLVPLDEVRHWYRYHHLFADVLNQHLERLMPEQIHDLHIRASEWFEQRGFIRRRSIIP